MKYFNKCHQIIRIICKYFFLNILLLFLILSNFSHAQMISGMKPWSNLVAVVKGEHLRAIMVAYSDFSKYKNLEYSKEIELKDGKDSFTAYLSNIDNYMIQIREGDKEYVVIFELNKNNKYKRVMGDGGLTGYLIDKTSFQIIDVDKGGK